MNKLKVIIADDEADALEVLSNIIKDSGKAEVIESISNPLKIESLVNKHKPDLLVLDIEMSGINGIQLIENIREYNIKIPIVFVTAYDKYISDAIKHNAFSYLLKPVDRHELYSIIDKVHSTLQTKANEPTKIKLPINDGYVFLSPNEIYTLEAEGNYTRIKTINEEDFISSYNMGRLFQKLSNSDFLRINRSCILNAKYLYKVNKSKKTLEARINNSSEILEISSSFLTEFNKANP